MTERESLGRGHADAPEWSEREIVQRTVAQIPETGTRYACKDEMESGNAEAAGLSAINCQTLRALASESCGA